MWTSGRGTSIPLSSGPRTSRTTLPTGRGSGGSPRNTNRRTSTSRSPGSAERSSKRASRLRIRPWPSFPGSLRPQVPRPESRFASIPSSFGGTGGKVLTNLSFFERLAPRVADAGIEDVRVSFAQWYGKAKRRAGKRGFEYLDPGENEKRARALDLAATAAKHGLSLHACAQAFLATVPGFRPSSCVDGSRLRDLHPRQAAPSMKKDRTQRPECGCTESRDIGSYAQICPHSCIYCYARAG